MKDMYAELSQQYSQPHILLSPHQHKGHCISCIPLQKNHSLHCLSSGIVIDATEVASLPNHLVDNGSAPGPSGWTGALLIPLLRDAVCCDGLARLLTL